MSTTKTSSKEDEEDEIENAFLSCDENIIDKLIQNEKLNNFELDIKEVMKSGCNRQIAEYALLKYGIDSILRKENEKYIKVKEEMINEIKDKLQNQIIGVINSEITKLDDFEYDIIYEEIFDELMDKIEKDTYIAEVTKKYYIKKRLIKLIISNKEINLEKFKKEREEYCKSREPVIEAALRLVKKIVNEEDEYKKFYEEYYKKKIILYK